MRAFAEACEQEAKSLGMAAAIPGFSWTPEPAARHMVLSYELRPSANRPGPANLWEQFDAAIERLGIAMEGPVMSMVACAYSELARVIHEIAEVLRRRAAG